MADNEKTVAVTNGVSSDYHEKTRGLFRNTISLAGAALAVVSLANIVFLVLLDVLSDHRVRTDLNVWAQICAIVNDGSSVYGHCHFVTAWLCVFR